MIRKTNTQFLRNPQPALLILIALSLLTAACGNNRPFDSAAWVKSDARARGRMAEDLVHNKVLIGKTVDEVRRVLGPADLTYPTALQYKIDLGWLFKDPKHYGLQVHLDDHRLVREVKIVD